MIQHGNILGNITSLGKQSAKQMQHVGSTGGLARKFNMWGGGGVGVGMQSRFWKLHTCWVLRHGNVGVWTSGFLCKHGTLLVCSCVHMVRCWCVMCKLGWGWGGDAFTFLEVAHAGCYAAATLVCELSVFYVNMVRQTTCMANRVKWIRCKLQVIVVFSVRFGEKNWRLDIVKTFNDQLRLKTWYAVYFWKNTFYM